MPVERLRKQVRRARWRLALQRFLGALGWCWFATAVMAFLLIAMDKYRPMGVAAPIWGIAAAILGLVAAAGWAMARGGGALDAAIEIDRRFGLKERVSSAMALTEEQRRSEVGRAVIEDAIRRVEQLDVPDQFAVVPRWPAILPLPPVVAAFLVAWLVSPASVENPARAVASTAMAKQIRQSSEGLKQRLLEQRKQAESQGLKDAGQLFRRLEEEASRLADKTQGDRKQALVKLNDLYQQMARRRDQLGDAEAIQKQLDQLKNISQGPADKLLQAIAQGDLKKAVQELEQLKSKLAQGHLTPEEKEKLVRQLQEMQNKLREAIKQQRQTRQDLENRIQQARQSGQNDLADKLQQQLDRLDQQMSQADQIQQMADKLGQCAQCLQNGNLKDADNMLEQLQSDLEGLSQQLQEMEMIQGAMDQLSQTRDRMNCPNCGGAGCEMCQADKPGKGLGQGNGEGDRPEEKTGVGFYDTKTQQKVGRGGATVAGRTEGPNVKGNVRQEIQAQLQAARAQATDPLTGQRMPRQQRQHAAEYFNRFREGR